ncbi:hypothetical protein FDB23_08710 [Clostridium botulinum]|nr:hypothetical protein [Clostridium botulinum]
MDKIIKGINEKIEKTSHLWCLSIGIIFFVEILNITLVKKYAPFGVDIVVSLLLLAIGIYYISVLYQYMYLKYKNYLEINKSEAFNQLEIFKDGIENISEEIRNDVEFKYKELTSKIENYKLEINQYVDSKFNNINANIKDSTKQIIENEDTLSEKINAEILHTNKAINNAFENNNKLIMLKTKELTQFTSEKSENVQKIILDKFAQQQQINEEKLFTLHKCIKEVLDKDIDGFEKIQETLTKVSDSNNKSLEECFDRVISNSSKKQSELNNNIDRVFSNLLEELKVESEKIINISNKSKQDAIDEINRSYVDKYNKQMEIINNVSNDINENYQGIVKQFDKVENSIVENIYKETSVFSSSLIQIQDVINKQNIDGKKNIKEVGDKIVENTNSITNSKYQDLSEKIKEISELMSIKLSNDKRELIENTENNKEKLAKVLEDVLIKTGTCLAEQTETIVNGIESNKKHLEDVIDKSVANNNSIINSNQEKLSIQIKEVSEHVSNQINMDKEDNIERDKESSDSLAKIINIAFDQAEYKIGENSKVILEKFETTKDEINSLIELKKKEVFIKLDDLNKESSDNLKLLLQITNNGVETGIKELKSKIDNSSSSLDNTVVDEISVVKKECNEIRKFINKLIEREEKCQNIIEKTSDHLKNQIELLQKEMIDEIPKYFNGFKTVMISDKNERNDVLNDKFNNIYQQIIKLSEISSNRKDKLDETILDTVSIIKAIDDNVTKKNYIFSEMLSKVVEKDTELALSAKNIENRQEETDNKIRNLEIQILALNNLVKILNKILSEQEICRNEVAITKSDPNRIEKIHDDTSGITIVNTFKNDILQYSEMQELGKKIFSAEYDSKGRILLSKNYNKKGEVAIENSYYKNGQVKERKEKIREKRSIKTEITKFDSEGRKLS